MAYACAALAPIYESICEELGWDVDAGKLEEVCNALHGAMSLTSIGVMLLRASSGKQTSIWPRALMADGIVGRGGWCKRRWGRTSIAGGRQNTVLRALAWCRKCDSERVIESCNCRCG